MKPEIHDLPLVDMKQAKRLTFREQAQVRVGTKGPGTSQDVTIPKVLMDRGRPGQIKGSESRSGY